MNEFKTTLFKLFELDAEVVVNGYQAEFISGIKDGVVCLELADDSLVFVKDQEVSVLDGRCVVCDRRGTSIIEMYMRRPVIESDLGTLK